MAVPKTMETRCRDGSVQERQGIQTLHKYPHPYIFFVCDILLRLYSPRLLGNIFYEKFLWFLALPSLHPSTFLENVFHTCIFKHII